MNAFIIIYAILVGASVYEKIGNYFDWLKKDKQDEKIALGSWQAEKASSGLFKSGRKTQGEQQIKDNFQFERRKRKRKFIKEFAWSIFPVDIFSPKK